MKLTVIGKYGPYGKAGVGAASSYLVENKGEYIVLDMGPGTLSRLQGAVDVKKIKYIWLSHLHYDHTSDFLAFRYLLEDLDHSVTLLTHKEDSEWYRIVTEHPLIKVQNIEETDIVKTETMTLRFYEMKHTVPCYAIRLEGDKTLVYTGDTLYNDNIPAAVKGADCILADCSKPVGFKGPHMTADIAENLYNDCKIPIIATHLSPDYDPTEDFANCDGITVAEEGKTYEI